MRNLLLLLLPLITLMSCGGTETDRATAAASLSPAVASAPVGKSCLADFEGSLCELMPKDIIQSFIPGPVEENSYKPEERGMISSCGYGYEDESNMLDMKVGKMTMKIPAEYFISIGVPDVVDVPDPKARFERNYKTFTEAEKAELQARMQKELKAKFDRGEMTKEQYEAALGFGKLAGEGNWEKVPNLGTAAAWGQITKSATGSEGTLAVLHGNVIFQLQSDAVESPQKSKEMAIAVAKFILQRCD